jgi:hypothetical protein
MDLRNMKLFSRLLTVTICFIFSGTLYAKDHLPDKPILISPAYEEVTGTTLLFDWEYNNGSYDKQITYTLTIARDWAFREIIFQKEEQNVSMSYVSDHAGLEDFGGRGDTPYYFWKVEAVDQFGVKTTSDTWSFTTDEKLAPHGVSSMRVHNEKNSKPISNSVNITVTPQQQQVTTEPSMGRYDFLVLEGTYEIKVSLPGYSTKRRQYTSAVVTRGINAGQPDEFNIFLTPYDFPSLDAGILTIQVVHVHNTGKFSVRLRLEETNPLTFILFLDYEQVADTEEANAIFSFESGQLYIPKLTVVKKSANEENQFVTEDYEDIRMQRVGESWTFELENDTNTNTFANSISVISQ